MPLISLVVKVDLSCLSWSQTKLLQNFYFSATQSLSYIKQRKFWVAEWKKFRSSNLNEIKLPLNEANFKGDFPQNDLYLQNNQTYTGGKSIYLIHFKH